MELTSLHCFLHFIVYRTRFCRYWLVYVGVQALHIKTTKEELLVKSLSDIQCDKKNTDIESIYSNITINGCNIQSRWKGREVRNWYNRIIHCAQDKKSEWNANTKEDINCIIITRAEGQDDNPFLADTLSYTKRTKRRRQTEKQRRQNVTKNKRIVVNAVPITHNELDYRNCNRLLHVLWIKHEQLQNAACFRRMQNRCTSGRFDLSHVLHI